MSSPSHAIEDILDSLHHAAERDGSISVDETVDALDHRGYGPFLFVPALVEITPIGGIPGVPTLLAVIIAIFAAQIAWGREDLWLPGVLSKRTVKASRMRQAADSLQPIARRLDRWFPGRLPQLTRTSVIRTAGVICLLLCFTVPPLELIPFASTAPMAAIATFGLAFSLRDGLLMAIGYALTAVAVGVGLTALIG
ncbi:exopolysaccharide biosynthesis protein [Histidinibacterium aquaticum]|uniref:Exopolysaccharide biosynthesis protein n=1 Tax=Histidinibacterium aquaticum TaxID=2613962 RepID=A0A5J5GLH4_9RHOB|nr:exopolysaccharide biosynthesis protein [Histidinibacterium aquaticum]KAA9008980.1 exopolysaccharide biosynthesis protein [Histidinibacterium aquaticum]